MLWHCIHLTYPKFRKDNDKGESKVHLNYFSKFWVGWVNSVPQHVNKRTNQGNTVAFIATPDS